MTFLDSNSHSARAAGEDLRDPSSSASSPAAVRVSSVNSQSEFNTIRKFTSSELMRLLKKEFVQEYY